MQDILTTASHPTILSLFPFPFTQICCFSISVYIRTGFPRIGNAAYQCATRQGTNYHVKHGRDNQVGAKESQEQTKKVSNTATATSRNPTNTQSKQPLLIHILKT